MIDNEVNKSKGLDQQPDEAFYDDERTRGEFEQSTGCIAPRKSSYFQNAMKRQP
jgi:hypothetical protein